MYSLRLLCSPDDVEALSSELWEAGTLGIREIDDGGQTILIAAFDEKPVGLSHRLATYQPEWLREPDTDWTRETERAWPARCIGDRIFLAPPWNAEPTPAGRVRLVHNPGLASGTGEHPCTQLALMALEKWLEPNTVIADIGTGSGILAITALHLRAAAAFALDTDEAALHTARENFALNNLPAHLITGSAACLASASAALVIANISGSVLLSIADDLRRILRSPGGLILTGFPVSELPVVQQVFGTGQVTGINEWRCLSLRVS